MRIKIFLASSKELEEERLIFADLVGHLNKALEGQDIIISLVKWEYVDASMGPEHKQEEYNEQLRDCDLCIVLYWTSFGKWTKMELDTAYEEKCAGRNPKRLYVYFKDSEEVSEELQKFRDGFPENYGHFFSDYKNIDTLKAHFLLQFMDYLSLTFQGKSIVEVKNGKVTIDGKEYVDLQNVPFAGNYEEYKNKLSQLKYVKKILMMIDDEDPEYKEYQEKLRVLQKDIKDMEDGLWDTALTITRLSNTRCSERIKRAADLFEKGDNKGARAVLNEDEIDHDIQHNINLIKLGEEGKNGLKTNIKELDLKLKLLKSAEFKFKDEKYGQIETVFKKVLECTIVLYGKESEETYDCLRRSYHLMSPQPKRYTPYLEEALNIIKKITAPTDSFSNRTRSLYRLLILANRVNGYKNRVIELYKEIIPVIKENCGENSEDYIFWLSDFGDNYAREKCFPEAEQIYKQCIDLVHKFNNYQRFKHSYYDLAKIYLRNHDIQSAKDTFDEYIEYSHGEGLHDHEGLLRSYLEIANYCKGEGNRLAETYYLKAIDLAHVFKDEISLASIYEGLAEAFFHLKDIHSGISYLQKAIEIRPDSKILIKLADRYSELGDYTNALQCAEESLKYAKEEYDAQSEREKLFLFPQLYCYSSLTRITRGFYDLEKSEYYGKLGLEIAIKSGDKLYIKYFCITLASISERTCNYNQALDYYTKVSQYGVMRKTETLTHFGWVYYAMGEYEKAEKIYREAIDICEEERNHLEYATPSEINGKQRELAHVYVCICRFYIWTNNFDKAQEALSKSYASSNSKSIYLMERELIQARIYIEKGMFKEAIKQLESNKPSEQLKCLWQQTMAEAYINWGKNPEALEWTNLLLQEYAENPWSHYVAGDYYAKFDDKAKAIEHYEFGLKLSIKYRLSLLNKNSFVSKIEQIKNEHNNIDN